jgi:AraC-like DNA-binding protein
VAESRQWTLIERLRQHAELCEIPFILYGLGAEGDVSLTNFVLKPVSDETLLSVIRSMFAPQVSGPILVVDDDPHARDAYRRILARHFPYCLLLEAANGAEAIKVMSQEVLGLIILDLMMPEVDGFEVIEWARANQALSQVPILVLSGKLLTLEDVQRLEKHPSVMVQTKGVWSEDEMAMIFERVFRGEDLLPSHTSAPVKRALLFLQQHYARKTTRAEIAQAVGVSGKYLSEIFRKELGMTVWEYLTRYRIYRAQQLLRSSTETITSIAAQVGFEDSAYFSRVFRNETGFSPRAYRTHR